jgi:Protein of unknown function (DUF3137)
LKTLAEFRLYYNRVIIHELRALEARRRRMILGVAIVVILVIAALVVIVKQHIPALSLFFWIPLVLLYQYLASKFKQYKKMFKPRVVNLILKFMHESLLYDPENGISEDRFMESSIFVTEPSSFQSEDLIVGTIGTVDFEMSEVFARQSPRVEGAPTILFRGLFFYTAIKETFEGRIIIMPKTDTAYLIRTIKSITRNGGSRAEIDDEAFNKYYVAYADNPSDVSNLLSDNIIQDIVDYYDKYNKKIYLSFSEGGFYVAVANDHDILEPNYWTSNVSFKLVKTYFDDLTLITNIVRDFDLNN